MTRFLDTHIVNPANDKLTIAVMDEPGSGGANHLYMISGFDTATNPVKIDDGSESGLPVAASQACAIIFQNGPIAEVGVNGITHEALLAILADRLESFQAGPYASNYNAMALLHIRSAQEFLHQRTKDRMAQGIEGTHAVGKESLARPEPRPTDAEYADRSTDGIAAAVEEASKLAETSKLAEAAEALNLRVGEAREQGKADAQKLKDYWAGQDEKKAEAAEEATQREYTGAQQSAIGGEPILKFFAFAHLPEPLQAISKNFSMLAHDIIHTLPRNTERSVALRKLLEAKDAAVRARL